MKMMTPKIKELIIESEKRLELTGYVKVKGSRWRKLHRNQDIFFHLFKDGNERYYYVIIYIDQEEYKACNIEVWSMLSTYAITK